jgi:hypothetical protein
MNSSKQKIKHLIVLLMILYVVSFLLHFVWEMWQIPFYEEMLSDSHWSGVLRCSQATLGDGVIALVSYFFGATIARNLFWVATPTFLPYVSYIVTGIFITILFEYFAVDVLYRWQYSELMPTLPLIGTGVLPLLQWLVIPPAVLWITKVFIQGQIGK